jgi:hypothetical protein
MSTLFKGGVQANGDNTLEIIRKRQARELLAKANTFDTEAIKNQLLKAKEMQSQLLQPSMTATTSSSAPSGRVYKVQSGSLGSGSNETDITKAWKLVEDPVSGKEYWWNDLTNKVRWEDPLKGTSEEGEKVYESLPWIQIQDPKTKAMYYWNCDTDQVSWSIPASGKRDDAIAEGVSDEVGTSDVKPEPAVKMEA